jgi:hypothetical protein
MEVRILGYWDIGILGIGYWEIRYWGTRELGELGN